MAASNLDAGTQTVYCATGPEHLSEVATIIDETIAENASVMMPSSDGRHLEIKAAKGALDKNSRFSEKSLGQVFAMGKGIAGSVALSLKPVIIHDAQKDPLFENKRTKVRIGSLMSMPLVYGRGELVAVLNLSHSRPHAFNERDLNLVNVLLPPAALALRNARAMKELEDINSLLKAELSMTDSALSEFGKNIFRIFTCMSVGVLTMDRNGTVTAINKKASELLGLEPGASMPSLVAEELVREPASEIREATRDIEHGGRILNIEVSSLPMKPDWQMLACVRDVTLERYKERELVRIKDQYKDMVENALDAGAQAAYRVDDASELDTAWFAGVSQIGVTSGASVPESLVEGVLRRLVELGYPPAAEERLVEESLTFSLPPQLRPHDSRGRRR